MRYCIHVHVYCVLHEEKKVIDVQGTSQITNLYETWELL